jgi:hypothetical protein
MQVRFIKTIAGPDPRVCGGPGEKRDIPSDIAKKLLKAGAVVELNPAPERRTAKAPRGKVETR